jgi:hypothetical protein
MPIGEPSKTSHQVPLHLPRVGRWVHLESRSARHSQLGTAVLRKPSFRTSTLHRNLSLLQLWREILARERHRCQFLRTTVTPTTSRITTKEAPSGATLPPPLRWESWILMKEKLGRSNFRYALTFSFLSYLFATASSLPSFLVKLENARALETQIRMKKVHFPVCPLPNPPRRRMTRG